MKKQTHKKHIAFLIFALVSGLSLAAPTEKYEISMKDHEPIVVAATSRASNEGVVEVETPDWLHGRGGVKFRLLQNRAGRGDQVFGRVTWYDETTADKSMVSSPFTAQLANGQTYKFTQGGKAIVTIKRIQ